jgi:hypothetical protein
MFMSIYHHLFYILMFYAWRAGINIKSGGCGDSRGWTFFSPLLHVAGYGFTFCIVPTNLGLCYRLCWHPHVCIVHQFPWYLQALFSEVIGLSVIKGCSKQALLMVRVVVTQPT